MLALNYRKNGVMPFTLFVPDGPMDPQIIAAVSSKDSFATDQTIDRVRLCIFDMLTEGWIVFSTDVDLIWTQSTPEVPVVNTLPEPKTVQSNGLHLEEEDPLYLMDNYDLFTIRSYTVHVYFFLCITRLQPA
jgi:hypothetical protein